MEDVAPAGNGSVGPHSPPPPPTIQPDLKPEVVTPPKYSIMSRRGAGTTGRPISLLSNHFKVSVNVPDAVFYQYSVCLPHATPLSPWSLLYPLGIS